MGSVESVGSFGSVESVGSIGSIESVGSVALAVAGEDMLAEEFELFSQLCAGQEALVK